MPDAPPEQISGTRPAALSALIVDDQPLLVYALAERLNMDGIETTVVSNAAQALEEYVRRDFDVVFLDFKLPDMTGDLVAAEMKKKQSSAKIVLMTGMLSILESVESGESIEHVDALLPKPWRAAELRNVLDSVRRSKE